MMKRLVRLPLLMLLPLAAATEARAQTRDVAVDPIRCWWRTSAGAVRTGETFSVLLTCAVVENEAVQVVPDESRLASSVVQLPPFEVVGGSHPEDVRTADRRFFQYEYQVRLINADFIGRDVALPGITLHYRINSRVSGNAAVQGRDHTYRLPIEAVRVLSMVPGEAPDIRDGRGESFAAVDDLRFRARLLEIVATTLIVLGSLMVAVTLVRLVIRLRRQGTREKAGPSLSLPAVLSLAARELSDVQRETEASGWTDDLVTRALAAARIAAGSAIGREPMQRSLEAAAGNTPAEGALARRGAKGSTVRVSSSVTSRELADRLAALPASASESTRALLTQLQGVLGTFTAAQYARERTLDRSALDHALSATQDSVRTLKTRYSWPTFQLRRWLGRPVDAA